MKNFQLFRFLKPAAATRWDGRLAVVAVVLLWLSIALGAVYSPQRDQIWRHMGVYAGIESFSDARVVTVAWDNVRQGHGAYDELPGEVPNQHFNYPRVWLLPHFLGLGARHTEAFAWAGILFFYLSSFLLMGRLTTSEALIYILILCSPASMLAVERGNTDLFVFGVVVMGVLWATKSGSLSMAVLCAAAVLKLFPVFALPICLRENKHRALTTMAIAGGGFFVYVLATLPDIVQVRAVTPHPTLFGFGCMTLVDGIIKWLAMHGHENHFTTAFRGLGFAAAVAVFLAAGWSGLKHRYQNASSSRKLDAFRAGALIYIGVFFIGNNYEYRLIFLVLCLGQLLIWRRGDQKFRRLAAVTLLAAGLAVWARWPLANELPGCNLAIPIAQIAHWTLFSLLAWFIGATLPDWLVNMVVGYLPGAGSTKPTK